MPATTTTDHASVTSTFDPLDHPEQLEPATFAGPGAPAHATGFADHLIDPDTVFPRTRRTVSMRTSPYGPSDDAPTSDFERSFCERLETLGVFRDHATSAPTSTPVSAPRRSTVTAMVTALRSAIGVDRLLTVARGLTPQAIADAYRHVDELRIDCTAALDRLFAEPTVDRFEAEYDVLVAFMPRMVWSLSRVLDEHPGSFADSVRHLEEQVEMLDRAVEAIESRIRTDDPNWPTLLAELDDGRNRGIYHHVCYRPRRVGDIVPVRLAYLLGDAQEGPTR